METLDAHGNSAATQVHGFPDLLPPVAAKLRQSATEL